MIIILILIALVICFIIFLIIKRLRGSGTLPVLIEKAETTAAAVRKAILESPVRTHFQKEEYSLNVMTQEYVRLKEQYSNDHTMLRAIATDWKTYNDNLLDILHAHEILDTDDSADAHERYRLIASPAYRKKAEIEERYKIDELGRHPDSPINPA